MYLIDLLELLPLRCDWREHFVFLVVRGKREQMETGLQNVRKKDFSLSMVLNPSDTRLADELVEAIFTVRPSFLAPRVYFEVYQPLIGSVHYTLLEMMKNGISTCMINTLLPNRPDLNLMPGAVGHICYTYEHGTVIEQQSILSKDVMDSEDFLVHTLLLEFKVAHIRTNEWKRPVTTSQKPLLRPFTVIASHPIQKSGACD